MNGQQLIICPNCGENKVKKSNVYFQHFALLVLCIVIPIIGWVLIPSVIFSAIRIPYKKNRKIDCTACKTTFLVPNELFKQYDNYLKGNIPSN